MNAMKPDVPNDLFQDWSVTFSRPFRDLILGSQVTELLRRPGGSTEAREAG